MIDDDHPLPRPSRRAFLRGARRVPPSAAPLADPPSSDVRGIASSATTTVVVPVGVGIL